MARWRKTLAKMMQDQRPTGYGYHEAVAVLMGLGFDLAPVAGGSHRKWRAISPNGNLVIIGLVESGGRPMKPYLIRDMLAQLERAGYLSDLLEDDNGTDG